MLDQASGIPTSSFDARPHTSKLSGLAGNVGDIPDEHNPAVPVQSAAAFADMQRENSSLRAQNTLLRKAITDISNELDDLVSRVGLVASRATAN